MIRPGYWILPLILMLVVVAGAAASECGACDAGREITATGLLKKQGITTYMYGSHVIRDEVSNKSYALTSRTFELDRYLDRRVTVKGRQVAGYPVEGGPEYLEVTSVEEANH